MKQEDQVPKEDKVEEVQGGDGTKFPSILQNLVCLC